MRDLEQLNDGELETLWAQSARNNFSDSTIPLPDVEQDDAKPISEKLKEINEELRRRGQR